MRFCIPLILLLLTGMQAMAAGHDPDSLQQPETVAVTEKASLRKKGNTDHSYFLPSDRKLLDFYRAKGISFDTTCSQIELYREIYDWLGVRYRYAGLTKRGVDCAGFVRNICNRIYGSALSGSAGHHFEKCIPIDRSELEEGDLVFFKIRKKYISHVGIYLGNGKFAHAAVHGGVMINDLSDPYYSKYYYLSGRLINAPNKKRW